YIKKLTMFDIFKKKYLYFPGCLTKFVMPEIVENYKKIFMRLNLKIYSMDSLNCCGAITYRNGYSKDFEELRSKNLNLLKESGTKKIVTNDPSCMNIFNELYSVDTIHVSQLIAKNERKLPVKFDERVNYYDGVETSVYDEPRQVLGALGFEVIELERNRENSIISGAEGGLIQNLPSLANKISKKIFEMCTEKKLIVSDPLLYYHLKNNAPKNLQVFELSEVVL
ncbi:MAG: (Fe-S)-binding protein, partial [Nanoarchaeota archaeon]